MNATRIANGPWLLAPSSHHITIVWEMEHPTQLWLNYQTANGDVQCCKPAYEREPSCPANPEGYCLYTVVLKDLLPGTSYKYTIGNEDGELIQASFTTLQAEPERIRCVTVSDSHLFYTSEAFADMLTRYRPDLLLHGGDISFGTGYQHEQYVNNWFARLPDALRRLPAYYIAGNHDDGPFFDWLFASRQAKSVNSPDGGFTFSFDYGPAHIVMVNSNPWGLFEMNAVNSGQQADDSLKEQIQASLKWIEADLTSETARNAAWRVLITHHPYTDIFNNRYIAPLAERCGVDLVIGGHLHYYIKSVSVDPTVGARTVYVCQGSTQDPAAELNIGTDDQRLLGDFPEVVAMGNNNYGILEATADELVYKVYGFRSELPDQLVDTVRLTHSEPQVELFNTVITCLDDRGLVKITTEAQNVGECPAVVVLPLKIDGVSHDINLFGEISQSRLALLNPPEKRLLTAYYRVQGKGCHQLSVLDVTEEIIVYNLPQLTYEHLKTALGTGQQADCLMVSVEVINQLDKDVTMPVSLYIDDEAVEIKRVSFQPHQRRCVEFYYRFEWGGQYQVSVGDHLPKLVYVDSGIQAVPRILDRSGRGHDALLHGSPRVVVDNGHTCVQLNHPEDYIEIPPSPDLVSEQGFTGLVQARVNRLAAPTEMSHNPIMVRGRSVGWGATYFMRMVIERNGGLKWGTCHGITEYSWQGGEAAVGKWAQYTLSFDKERGGISYVDDEPVAHIAGIDPNDKLRQWDTEPIFVGYSYIGHVIPDIGRPKYYTHLPAAIRQVRFYKHGLSAEDNKRVLEVSNEAGPHSDDLAVWLDFDHIKTFGQHITEWRHPAVYSQGYLAEKKCWCFQTLKARTSVPNGTKLRALIEVSDDGVSIKQDMMIELQDGDNVIDLVTLPKSQFLRIITDFNAVLGSDGVFVPAVMSYAVTASNGADTASMVWSTRPSWERGELVGAVGFNPIERLREFPEYTDVIHG